MLDSEITPRRLAEIGEQARRVLEGRQEKGGRGAGDAKRLEAEGWRKWYAELFGRDFVDSLDSSETEDRHHSEAIEWHWESRRALLRGDRPPHDWFAYFPTWARGNLKSTIAEALVITDAGLSSLYKQPGYCLYLRREKDKLQESVSNIEALLSGDAMRELFPLLSQVARNEETNQRRQWTASFLHTKADYVIRGGTVRSAQAGSRVVKTRPTFIVPDDIEGREDSPVIAENNFVALTTEILPMRQANTLTFWAQNLISRYTARYRIEKGHARVLTNRKPTVPVPAVRDLVTATGVVDGVVRDLYVSGRPTWRVWTPERVQDEINAMGLPAFKKECQHEVEQDREGLVLQHWDDSVHVISRSEFAGRFGTSEMPRYWYKYPFNDWARTKTAKHANVAGILTVSAQNSQLPGCVFMFHPMSFPAASAPDDVAKRLLETISPVVRVEKDGQAKSFTWEELIKSTLQKTSLDQLITSTSELVEKRRTVLARIMPRLVGPVLRAQNYHTFRMSHERKDVRRVYSEVFGLPFQASNPGADGGVDSINLLMKVDYSEDHPFRQGKKGFSNFFLVVDDDPLGASGPPPYNDALTPDDLHDAELCRYQFKNWRVRDPYLTVKGEYTDDLLKMNDDFGNGLMMMFHDGIVRAVPLTASENVEAHLNPILQTENILAETDNERKAKLWQAQIIAKSRIERDMMRPKGRSPLKRYEWETKR